MQAEDINEPATSRVLHGFTRISSNCAHCKFGFGNFIVVLRLFCSVPVAYLAEAKEHHLV